MNRWLNRISLVGGLASLIYGGYYLHMIEEAYTKQMTELRGEIKTMNKKWQKTNQHLKRTGDQLKKVNNTLRDKQRQIDELEKQIQDLKVKLHQQHKETAEAGRSLVVEATYYTPHCLGCTGRTKTGINVSENVTYKGLGIVAVDPSVIPLGSIVFIEGKKYVAADTGGAIKGRRIDILVKTRQEAIEKGRHDIKITFYPPKKEG